MQQPVIREHLDSLGVSIRRFLAAHLPVLGDDWWQRGVHSALSYQQRQIVQEHGWTELDQLDLAALIRLVDANWDFLRQRSRLSFEARNWLKEALSVRNRDAHTPPNASRDPKRDYRDLDTLARLAEVLDPGSPEAGLLTGSRDAALQLLSERPPALTPDLPAGLNPGTMVRLIARKEVIGVVTGTTEGAKEERVRVFHDGAEHGYFRSQLELLTASAPPDLDPENMRAALAAAAILQPSATHIYSFNSGRIDYEPYQFRPVMKLIAADRPRLLIADDVGVGKTIEAGLIIKELQARQNLDSVLVICPKQLVVERKWRNELKRFDEDFVELDSATLRYCLDEARLEGQWPSRFRKAILPYSLLDERLLLGAGEGRQKRHGLVSLVPPVKFDLVIVDEAHHVRNRDTWRHRVVKHLIDSAEAAVLISATPIQTGTEDLFTLLQLLRPDLLISDRHFEQMREPNAFIARAEELTRRAGEGWQFEALTALEAALATAWGSAVLLPDPQAQATRELLERPDPTPEERVQAVRSLQRLNTFSGLINRTRRRDIGAFTVRVPETVEVDFTADQAAVHAELLDLCARIVTAQQPTLSVEFLLSTLQRQASSCINGLAPFIADLLESRLSGEELSEADLDDGWTAPESLAGFRNEIRALASKATLLSEDPKLDALLSIISDKQQLANNKILVFSTFRHTLRYLLPRLEAAGVRVGLVHGGVDDSDRRDIRARFALDRADDDALDVLLSSEVGTEGLDNQFCDALVNYDIPWNPMRIEQRIGRIDRRGQQSEAVSIKNMIVRGTVDARVYHRCLDRIGVFRQSLGGSEEILGELTREMRAIAEDLKLSDQQRDERLQQLADNKLARIHEQTELEEREGALFGLAVQRLDDEGVDRSASRWLSAAQLGVLVSRYLADHGFVRADGLFDRPVAVLRPDKALRVALLNDARALGSTGGAATPWIKWLERDNEASRRLTFEPNLAVNDDVELLSATHPLVRCAARHVGAAHTDSTVSLQTGAATLPSGRYPFAAYRWTSLGVRDAHEIRILTPQEDHGPHLERLILEATMSESGLTPLERNLLDECHYEAWSALRAEHIDRTRVHVTAQLSSLQLTHRARVAQLEDQLAGASHENIRRMKESELRSAENDFEQRCRELEQAINRCDITSTKLFDGVLEVM